MLTERTLSQAPCNGVPRRAIHDGRAVADDPLLGWAGATLAPAATCANTASRLNEAGFCRGGNAAKSAIDAATTACIKYS